MGSIGNRVIYQYFEENLLPVAVSADGPAVMNVSQSFRDFLLGRNLIGPLSADEAVEEAIDRVLFLLERRLSRWECMAVPRPLGALVESGRDTYLTWRHLNYTQLTGYESVPESFASAFHWLGSLSPKEFVLASAAYLGALRASPIFVTEQPNDAGVDCIGRIAKGPLHSYCFFVQAKSASGWLGRELVSDEYGKYLCLAHSERYREYRKALGIDSYTDGCQACYVIACNSEFKDAAIEFARTVGFVLRSRIQLAWFLANAYDVNQLQLWAQEKNFYSSLERDVSKELSSMWLNS